MNNGTPECLADIPCDKCLAMLMAWCGDLIADESNKSVQELVAAHEEMFWSLCSRCREILQ